jgi:hypothetical protein
MAIDANSIIKWLNSLPINTSVGIDEGGLALQVVDHPDVYLEVGGLPENDTENEVA